MNSQWVCVETKMKDDDECSWLGLQALMDFFKVWTNPLGSWVYTHENVLEEKIKINTTKVVFSAQKRGEEKMKNYVLALTWVVEWSRCF